MTTASTDVTTYTIALDSTLNPVIAYINQAGETIADDAGIPYQCNDAGLPDACYGQTTSLLDYFLTVADNQRIQALEVDALLQVPINETVTGATYSIQVSGDGDSSGAYLVAFHIATD
jgi:hypothetical protein